MAVPFLSGASANGQKIINVGTPTTSTDAATKGYVDSADVANVFGLSQGMLANRWYPVRPGAGTITAGTGVSGTLNLWPWMPTSSNIISGLAYEITTQAAGTGTDSLRVGLWADNGVGHPTGSALYDSGLLDLKATVGVKTTTVSWNLTGGNLYWFGVVRQVTGTITTAGVQRFSGIGSNYMMCIGDGSATPAIGTGGGPALASSYAQTGVTGALTSTSIGTLTVSTSAVQIILIRF